MNKNLTLIIFIFFISLFSFPHTASAGTTIGVSPNVMSLTNGLVGYWSFDGNDVVNGVIRDKSGNGNHGNAINIASSTFYTQGKLGQGGKFDGGDDVVNVSNDPSFFLGEQDLVNREFKYFQPVPILAEWGLTYQTPNPGYLTSQKWRL